MHIYSFSVIYEFSILSDNYGILLSSPTFRSKNISYYFFVKFL